MSELQQQLRQIRQAAAHSRRVVSFLYPVRESDQVSVDDVHRQARVALGELSRTDPRLGAFGDTLLADSSIDFDRELQTEETNRKLDVSLADLLRALSPYFMLPQSHLVHEYLIRRYRSVSPFGRRRWPAAGRVRAPPHPLASPSASACPPPPLPAACGGTTSTQ